MKIFICRPIGSAAMIKRIHVNQHNIRFNKKTGSRRPVMSVKTSKKNHTGNSVEISGPCKVVYSPDKPLSCGARVWIETHSEVYLDGVEVR